MDHRQLDVAAVVDQLTAQRIGEAPDARLGAAVRGLQRDAPIRQRRAHLDNVPAVARQHAPQRGHGPIHLAEVRHLGHATELLGRDLLERREDRRHGVVDPDIDRAELFLDPVRGGLDLVGVGHVRGQHQGLAPGRFDILAGSLQAVLPGAAACDQPDVRTVLCELLGGGAPHAGRCAGDGHDLRSRHGAHARILPRHKQVVTHGAPHGRASHGSRE